jgi:kumamolisin
MRGWIVRVQRVDGRAVRILSSILLACGLLASGAAASGGSAASSSFLHGFAVPHQVSTAYTPDDISHAYDFGPLYDREITGGGQTVALIEADRLSTSDLKTFDLRYNLPDAAVQEFYVGGTPFTLQRNAETNLDVEWLHALAPDAAIQLYYIRNGGNADRWKTLASAVRLAATHGAKIASISLGTCQGGKGTKVVAKAFAAVMKAGMSVFVSSGDDGAYPGPVRQCGRTYRVAYPAGDPSVVAVGGTSLELNDDGTIADERAWNLSGGGNYLTKYAPLLRPAWQVAPSIPKDKYRWAPDVAFVADPDTGVSMEANGHWSQTGGTSVGAPAWAAIWALLRQDAQLSGRALDVAPRVIYRIGNSAQYSTAFHDIVSGSNGKYVAGAGWDAVTGWGTPDVNNMAAALAAGSGATSP